MFLGVGLLGEGRHRARCLDSGYQRDGWECEADCGDACVGNVMGGGGDSGGDENLQ